MTSGTALARAAGTARSASRGWGALAGGSGRGFLIACAVTMLALVTSRRWPAPPPCPVTPGQPVPVGWPGQAGAALGPAGQQRLALPGLGRPPLREALGNARSQR